MSTVLETGAQDSPAAADGAREGVHLLGGAMVLAGGLSHEREVSLRSGRRVTDALHSAGIEARLHDADSSLLHELEASRPDAVFVALHGGDGEDGALRGILEMTGIPYVGSEPGPCRLAFDKSVAKTVLSAAGLRCPMSHTVPASMVRELGAAAVLSRLVEAVGLPLVVKPVRGGSALGATVVRERDALAEAMVACFGYGEDAMVECHVFGIEVAVAVVETADGPQALPAVEIDVVGGGPYDYEARYTAGTTDFYVPARLEQAVAERAADAALRAHRALGLRDLSRTDLVVSAAGEVSVLEVNVSPGMTETSLLPLAVTAAGWDLGQMCADLLRRAAARQRS